LRFFNHERHRPVPVERPSMIIASKHRKESDSRAFDSLTCPPHAQTPPTSTQSSVTVLRYDVFLGYDLMVSARMAMSSDTHTVRWGDLSTAWKDPEFLKVIAFQQHLASPKPAQLTARDIYSAKLYQVDTLSLAQQQVHSSQRQRDDIGKKNTEASNYQKVPWCIPRRGRGTI
jgi:hypothetical protein